MYDSVPREDPRKELAGAEHRKKKKKKPTVLGGLWGGSHLLVTGDKKKGPQACPSSKDPLYREKGNCQKIKCPPGKVA